MNTEIMLPVPELKQALGGLNKLIGRKTTLPVLGCLRVTRQKNGFVTLQGTDLDAFATYTFTNSQSGEPLDVLVPAEQLNKVLKCSNSKDVVALVREGKTTKLRYSLGGNPVHQPVNTLPVDEWPPAPEITADSSPLPPGFGEALKQAMQCCSEDPSRAVLRGACLDARNEKAHYIVGTNGRFLFSANSFNFAFKDAVIVPDSKFINGSGLLDSEPCFLAIQPGKKPSDAKQVSITNQQWQFVTREIEGQYPNWKQVVPEINSGWTILQLSAAAMAQMLTVLPNLPGTDGDNNTIRLRTGNKCVWVEGIGKDDKDWTSVAIADVTVTGKAKEISLNREYLLPALKFGLSELAILDELSPMVASRGGKRMVIMPVRPNGSAPTAEKPKPASTSVPPTPEAKPNAEEKESPMPKETPKPETAKSPEVSLLDLIEQVKESAKNLVRDLNGLTDAVKQAEKDRRTNEKELENARAVLKKLQQVQI